MELRHHIEDFAKAVGSKEIEIYKEFSLQHELGLFLRNRLSDGKVQFERYISHSDLSKTKFEKFEKKEIDIVITASGSGGHLTRDETDDDFDAFEMIEIEGEPLSKTVLRERR